MIRGIYSAATALDAANARQDATAENLAHVATPGYRARGVAFDALVHELGPAAGGITGTRVRGGYIDFTPGPLRHTGAPLHLAAEGDAFFNLQGPGGTLYTRNGSFRLGDGGQIMSDGGYPVLGQGGPISIPAEATNITVSREGYVSADGVQVGQLQLTRFENVGQLRPVGPTLFAAPPTAGAIPAQDGVSQGYLEGSNVNAASTMVEMIQTSRYFEMAQRALRAISDAVQMNTRPD